MTNFHGKLLWQITATNSHDKFLPQTAMANNHYKYMRKNANNVTLNTSYSEKKFHVLYFNLREIYCKLVQNLKFYL